jgi:hypothetical protein
MKLLFVSVLFFVTVAFNATTHADDSDSVQGTLAVAKFTGGCGILESADTPKQ